ncbi:MAG: hypothetical protein KDA90_15515 [Planctomycetaceae bacterium]|nr:hypothetical protein [Planctomycetaceae bacterium]
MLKRNSSSERQLEIMLVLITLAMASVLYSIETSQVVILNLFFLPIIMAGFFLGRYRAGVLAFLSVISATIVIAQDVSRFSFNQTPLMVILSIMIWGAVLGMAALLVGTLCDDRNARALEAHEAHVGVVEVLARYLQSADSRLHDQAMRIVQLCEQVAQRMRLPRREVDDLRVAAMLMDVENIEITARVIRKAVGHMDAEEISPATIHGTELVQSLRNVLSGASPLILGQTQTGELPMAARVLKVVRTFVELENVSGPGESGAEFALDVMRHDPQADELVLEVLEHVLDQADAVPSQEHPRTVTAQLVPLG